MQRPQHHQRNGRGAIGVGDQFFALVTLTVDGRHQERNRRVVTEGRGVIDDVGIFSQTLAILQGESPRHTQEDDIARGATLDRKGFDQVLALPHLQALARRTARGHAHHFIIGIFKQLQHGHAHCTGAAHHGDFLHFASLIHLCKGSTVLVLPIACDQL
ncbi:hypothetical protein D3C84_809360 [compost metagenome]